MSPRKLFEETELNSDECKSHTPLDEMGRERLRGPLQRDRQRQQSERVRHDDGYERPMDLPPNYNHERYGHVDPRPIAKKGSFFSLEILTEVVPIEFKVLDLPRFNNELLEVQDMKIEMIVSILIHGLPKGPFAVALAHKPPTSNEEFMEIFDQYIRGEEIIAMKEGEWRDQPHRNDRGGHRLQEEIGRDGLGVDQSVEVIRYPVRIPPRLQEQQSERGGHEKTGENAPRRGILNTIAGGPTNGDSQRQRKRYARQPILHQVLSIRPSDKPIIFDESDEMGNANDDPMVITMDITNFEVRKVLVDSGSSMDIVFLNVIHRMEMDITTIELIAKPLRGFGGSEVMPLARSCYPPH
ncbi:UNVERIFIED_CONTAM: hypothetical protein Sradi_3143100 [Sesamum radiatum]|uniref:Uncharacterized protein n=1 Tax=Sesamum radiatum TaxID=300843 RepID=A0AAW2RFN4_SESRA